MRCRRDTEENDIIHTGSDHRSVMPQFVAASKKEHSQKAHIKKKKTPKADSIKSQDDGTLRNMFGGSKSATFQLVSKIKAAAAQKPNEIESAGHNLDEDAHAAAAEEKAKKPGAEVEEQQK